MNIEASVDLSGIVYWLIVWTLFSWLLLGPWFYAMTRMKNMGYKGTWSSAVDYFKDEGWIVAIPMLIFLPIGALADAWFNQTWGSVIFRERPFKELMYTSRVKRHAEAGNPVGLLWKQRINKIQPGHI